MICKTELSRIIEGITKAVEDYPVTRVVRFQLIPQFDRDPELDGELVSLNIELDFENIKDISILKQKT